MGWTGDSRAVLGRREPSSGKCRAVSLTRDHKPINPAEKSRIMAAGGRIERCPFLAAFQLCHHELVPTSARLLCCYIRSVSTSNFEKGPELYAA